MRRWKRYLGSRGIAAVVMMTVALIAGVASTGTAEASAPAPLGVPSQVDIAVPDLEAAREQLEAGTGARFAPVTTSRVAVTLAEESGTRSITLRRTHSLHGEPALVLEQVSPPVGPWEERDGLAPTFLTYPVTDLESAGTRLRNAGLTLAASADDFAIWRTNSGVMIRLVDARSAGVARPSGEPDASGLGPIRSVTLAPCDVNALKDQFSKGLGVRWKTPMAVPLVWQHADGTTKPVVHQVHATQERAPHLTIETPDPTQSCTSTHTPVHLAYFTTDLVQAERRLDEAGMTFLARSPLLTTYFRTAGGIYLEIGSNAFQLAELLP